ncbi:MULTISPECIES: ACT domain-containing protein [Methanobacterium]|uniref:ACT domain-containing protein n=1 Tax=Methanobacterium veterum TaxID=408577 RepID=A0A9E5A573_9EURY|nr:MULTISPECIES: ACT domain-containing protein [Methanobacterium]MCZ3364813.1 ACT domain-containing protein [Methanobacterium veterum]MCZ3372567.1 ACT domain-containing protein [Methanobacterium veterum]
MKVKQLSIFLENRKGRMRKALDVLEKGDVNIRALSIADTSDFGILRLIVPEPDKTKKLLEDNNFIVKIGEVIAVRMQDQPGGLGKILGILDDNDINLEYLYAFVEEKENGAIVLLHPEDIDGGIKALQNGGAEVIPAKDIYGL